MTDPSHLSRLCRLGRLLDEAIDLADACDETLLGAQIAQAMQTLDTVVGRVRTASFAYDPRSAGENRGRSTS